LGLLPRKLSWEPEHHPFGKENPLQTPLFLGVQPLVFGGVFFLSFRKIPGSVSQANPKKMHGIFGTRTGST